MKISGKYLAIFGVFSLTLILSVASYSDDFFEDIRLNPIRDDDFDNADDLYPDYRLLNKRAYPRWHHSAVFRGNPTFRTSSIAEIKRFLPPFHPMARFRGLSSHSSGGIPSQYKTREDFETLMSSSHMQPNPSHPVLSDPKIRVSESEEEINSSIEQSDDQGEKMNAGDILRYLSSMSRQRDGNGRARVFRFGIK